MAEDNLPEGFVVDQPATTFSDLPEGFKIDQQRRNYLPSTVSGAVSSFLEPITSYPATYSEMNKEAREQVGHGVDQLSKHESAWDVVKGVGNVGLGSLGYVSSPISAGIRTIVGKPIEEATGIPKEYTEFATSLALPGIGFSRIPGAPAVPKMPTRGPLGVTLSEGQASGELPLIQREQAALRGQSGAPAHARAQEFAAQQAEQLSAAKENIARGFDEFGNIIAETPQEGAGAAAQRFRSSAASAKKDVTQAYKTARDIPGEIRPEAFDNIVPTVQKTLSELPDPVIVNELTPWANKAMDLLKDKVTNQKLVNKAESSTGAIPVGEEATLSGINLNGIDQWRKQLSAMRRNSFNPQNMSDYRATSAILDAFDSHIDQAVNSGMFRGDPRAVQAWNDARAAFSDYKSTFGKQSNDPVGRVVQKVLGDRINEPASANAVADHLFGSSGINPSDLNRGVAQRFKNVIGENSSEWSGVKQGLFSRLTEKGADLANWGPKNTADRINKFLNIDGKEMANVVYSPAERQAIQSYADLLRKLEVPQAGANWGNTGTAKVFQKIGGDISPIIGTLLGSNAGHAAGLPWGVGEAAGIGLTKGSQMLANTIEARKISKQMPILANQMQAWSKSYIKSQKTPTPASQRMLVSAATTLDSTLRKFGTSLDQVSQGTSDETNEPPRTIPQITIHKEPPRATGGSVFDKMHAAKHMQQGGGLESFIKSLGSQGAAFGTQTEGEQAGHQRDPISELGKGAYNAVEHLAKENIDNANLLATGNRDQFSGKPGFEAGMLTMGTGAVAGVPMRAGEFALGSGPIKSDPNLWHGISKIKLPKPISEMNATRSPIAEIAEKQIVPSDLQGGLLLPAIGDRSIANANLHGFNGYKFEEPVPMQGGHGFMAANADKDVAWASGSPVIGRIASDVRKLNESGNPIYFPYTAMGERSVDFSHHISSTLAEALKQQPLTRNAERQFNAAMKSDAGSFGAVKNWPGVNSPYLKDYLLSSKGDVRNKFAKLMDTNNFQSLGFPNVAEARFAVTDPRLLNAPTGAAGISVSKLDPSGKILKDVSGHLTYDTDLGGKYVGGLGRSIPKEVFYPDLLSAYKKLNYEPFQYDYLMSRGVTGAPRAQKANQKWVDNVSKWIEKNPKEETKFNSGGSVFDKMKRASK